MKCRYNLTREEKFPELLKEYLDLLKQTSKDDSLYNLYLIQAEREMNAQLVIDKITKDDYDYIAKAYNNKKR